MKRALSFQLSAFSFIVLVFCVQLAGYCAEADITAVEKSFLEGRYERAAYDAGKLIDSGARHRDELYYIKGLSELKLTEFTKARNSFNELLNKYPSSVRAFDANTGIGDAYFLEGKYDSALKAYNDTVSKFPNDKNTAVLYDRIGECHRKLGSGASETPASNIEKTESRLPMPQESGISVQVGCFKSKHNADLLSEKLSKRGYESRVELPVNQGDSLYRVKVGHPRSKEEANDLAIRLKRSGYSTKICTNEICR